MNYDEFKVTLQEEIQANVSKPINFLEMVSTRVNETLEAIILKLDGENAAPLIYPQKLYADYQAGIPLPMIAASVSEIVTQTEDYPRIPQFTQENAQKCISFALINKAKNKDLLETCPYKDVLDLAAVPKWYTERGSFWVDNNIMQMLHMTREEVLGAAQKNTESNHYICRDIISIIRESMIADGIDIDLLDELYPAREPFMHVLTNRTKIDGSCAVLSDRFMQEVAERLGTDELYLLPSSRDEMLAVNPAIADDIAQLKDMVMSVNRTPGSVRPENVLSDSVYCYNAVTHTLSLCDGMGVSHAGPAQAVKQTYSRGRGRS